MALVGRPSSPAAGPSRPTRPDARVVHAVAHEPATPGALARLFFSGAHSHQQLPHRRQQLNGHVDHRASAGTRASCLRNHCAPRAALTRPPPQTLEGYGAYQRNTTRRPPRPVANGRPAPALPSGAKTGAEPATTGDAGSSRMIRLDGHLRGWPVDFSHGVAVSKISPKETRIEGGKNTTSRMIFARLQFYIRPVRAGLVPASPDGISRPAPHSLEGLFAPPVIQA